MDNLVMMTGFEFEKKFIEVIGRKIDERINANNTGASRKEISDQIWKNTKAKPDNVLYALEKLGRRLNLEEAYEISKVLGYTLPALLWEVLMEMQASKK